MKIIITEDQNCDMIKIENEKGNCAIYGNYWDINRTGQSFLQLFKDLGIEVELVEKPFDEWG